MSHRMPSHLIEHVARALGLDREVAASLSLLTVADLIRVGAIPPLSNAEKDQWVSR